MRAKLIHRPIDVHLSPNVGLSFDNGFLQALDPGIPFDRLNMDWQDLRPADDGRPKPLDTAVEHLFKEYWFRETGEGPGKEAPHGPQIGFEAAGSSRFEAA